MLVWWPLTVKGVRGLCLELRGIRSSIIYYRIRSNYSRILKISSINNGLQSSLKFVHPLRVTTSIFWTILLFEWRFGRFKIGVLLTFSILRRTFSLLLFPFVLTRGSVRLGALLLVCQKLSYHHLEVIDRLLLDPKHLLLLLLHPSLLFESPNHLLWSSCHKCKVLLLHIIVGWLRFCDSGVLIACFNSPGQGIVAYWSGDNRARKYVYFKISVKMCVLWLPWYFRYSILAIWSNSQRRDAVEALTVHSCCILTVVLC